MDWYKTKAQEKDLSGVENDRESKINVTAHTQEMQLRLKTARDRIARNLTARQCWQYTILHMRLSEVGIYEKIIKIINIP